MNKIGLVFLLMATFFITPSMAYDDEEKEVIKAFQSYLCPKLQLKEEYFETGFAHIGKLDGLTEDAVYQKGLCLRNGMVKGLEEETVERLILQLICFQSLHSAKAMHNEASTRVNLARLLKTRPENEENNPRILHLLYQEAWYLFSLADLQASKKNRKKLVKDKEIDWVLDNPEIVGKFNRGQSQQALFENTIDGATNVAKNFMAEIMDEGLEFIKAEVANVFTGFGQSRDETLAQLNSAEAKRVFNSLKTDCSQTTEKGLADLGKGILDSPFQLELEKRIAQDTLAIKPVFFTSQTFSDLTSLFGQLMTTISTTRTVSQKLEEVIPLTVFIGRSAGWLAILQKKLSEGNQLSKKFDFKHALVTGLSREPYTEEQKVAYKRYLDFLGFDKVPQDHPIMLTDVAETGISLKRFSKLLKELYGFSNIQFAAIMFNTQTLNLKRARVIYITSQLSNIMFAKHEAKAKFSSFSQLYPTQWKEWEKYVLDFQPQPEALELHAQLEEWMGSDEGKLELSKLSTFATN